MDQTFSQYPEKPISSPYSQLRWCRRLIATKYDGSKANKPGRPRVMIEIRKPALRFATENRTWGYDGSKPNSINLTIVLPAPLLPISSLNTDSNPHQIGLDSQAVDACVKHYNHNRPHQGLGNLVQ